MKRQIAAIALAAPLIMAADSFTPQQVCNALGVCSLGLTMPYLDAGAVVSPSIGWPSGNSINLTSGVMTGNWSTNGYYSGPEHWGCGNAGMTIGTSNCGQISFNSPYPTIFDTPVVVDGGGLTIFGNLYDSQNVTVGQNLFVDGGAYCAENVLVDGGVTADAYNFPFGDYIYSPQAGEVATDALFYSNNAIEANSGFSGPTFEGCGNWGTVVSSSPCGLLTTTTPYTINFFSGQIQDGGFPNTYGGDAGILLQGGCFAGSGSVGCTDVTVNSTATRTAGNIFAARNNTTNEVTVDYQGDVAASGLITSTTNNYPVGPVFEVDGGAPSGGTITNPYGWVVGSAACSTAGNLVGLNHFYAAVPYCTCSPTATATGLCASASGGDAGAIVLHSATTTGVCTFMCFGH